MHALLLSAALLCFVAQYVMSAPGALDTELDELLQDYQDMALQEESVEGLSNDQDSFVDSNDVSKMHAKRRRRKDL